MNELRQEPGPKKKVQHLMNDDDNHPVTVFFLKPTTAHRAQLGGLRGSQSVGWSVRAPTAVEELEGKREILWEVDSVLRCVVPGRVGSGHAASGPAV